MAKTSLGIDIGLNSVKIVELTKKATGAPQVTKAAIRYGAFDPDATSEERSKEIAGFVKRMREGHKIASGKAAVVSMPCVSFFVRYVDILGTKRKKDHELIEYEAQQQIPLPIKEVGWDYKVLQEIKGKGKNIMLVAVKKDAVNEAVDIVKRAGLGARTVSLDLFCLLNTLKHKGKFKRSEGIIIVDIGAQSTGVLINRGQHIWLRTFGVGGRAVTENIVQAAEIEFSVAEAIKKEGVSRMPTTFDRTKQKKVEEAEALAIDNLMGEVERTINFYKMEHMAGEAPDLLRKFHIVITGGGSKVRGIASLFEKKLAIPTTLFDSFTCVSVSKNVLRKSQLQGIDSKADIVKEVGPLLGVAVGAALLGLEASGYEINFLKKDIAVQKTVSMTKYLRAASYLFIFTAFLINFLCQRGEVKLYAERLQYLEKVAGQMDTLVPPLVALEKDTVIARNKSIFLANTLQKRYLWLEMLSAVASVMPKDVWLTSFQADGRFGGGKSNELILNGMTLSYDPLNEFIKGLRGIDTVGEVKPESVLNENERFNFLLKLEVKNGSV